MDIAWSGNSRSPVSIPVYTTTVETTAETQKSFESYPSNLPPQSIQRVPANPPLKKLKKDLDSRAALAPIAVDVPAGFNSRSLYEPINELGMHLWTIDRTNPLGEFRRNQKWTLKTYRPEFWRWYADASTEGSTKLLYQNHKNPIQYTLETGFHFDRREVPYIENAGTPYTFGDDFNTSFRRKSQDYFAQAKIQASHWKTLIEYDQLDELTRSGVQLSGERTARNVQGSAVIDFTSEWKWGSVTGLRTSDYLSYLADESLTLTNNPFHYSTIVYQPNPHWKWSASPGWEQIARNEQTYTRSSLKGGAEFFSLKNSSFFEASLLARGEIAQENGTSLPSAEEFSGILTTTTQSFFGFEGMGRRFELLPSPIQRFGDGALLLPNPDLPNESGYRWSIGPWVKTSNYQGRLTYFYEQSTHVPILVGVTPSQAKTLALDGVWAQGVESKNTIRFNQVELSTNWTFQNAVNNSAVEWQRGNAIPGRPNISAINTFTLYKMSWEFKLGHEYRGREFVDLSESLSLPERHSGMVKITYRQKDWKTSFGADHLFTNRSLPEYSTIENRAGPSVFQPLVFSPVYHLDLECIL